MIVWAIGLIAIGMLDATVKRIAASPLDPLADTLARLGIGANVLTTAGFFMGLVAAGLIANGAFLAAVLFLALNRVADVLDGMVARRTRETAVGAFLDSTLDFFAYAAVPFAFALARQQDALAAIYLMMGLTVAAVPAIAVRSSTRTKTPVFTLCGHSETFIAFVLMCIAPRWLFSVLAYFYGLLCVISAGVGIASALTILRAEKS